VKREIGKNAMTAAFTDREDTCYRAMLAKYAAWARGGSKPPHPNLGLPRFYSSVWDTVRTGAVANMPLDERLAFATFYNQVETQNALHATETEFARELDGYAYQDGLTPPDANAVLRVVGRLQSVLQWKISNAEGMIQKVQSMGVALPPIPAPAEARVDGICAQAGAPPPQWPK
jgi:hypothetical protein